MYVFIATKFISCIDFHPFYPPQKKEVQKMRYITNIRTKFNIIAIFALLAFASTTFASGLSVGRIIPTGKVTLFQGNQKIGEFSSEAPFPEGALLSVQGVCGVKMSDLYLLAIDRSLFSVTTDPDSRILAVKNGTVYFSLSSMPHTLVFHTPDGVVTTHQILLNASTESGLMRGYVSVEDGISRIGVLEGGSMLLSVGDDKIMKINAGQELRLAQAGLFGEEEEEETKTEEEEEVEPTEGMSTYAKVGIAVLGAGAIAAAAGGGGGGGGGASPSTP
jgi:hypothetical protein